MPYSYRLMPEERIASCKLDGPVEIGETIQLFRDLHADPEFPEGWGVFVDVRERIGIPSSRDVVDMAEVLQVVSSRVTGRIGFLAGWTAQYGMARMLEIRGELIGVPVRGFEDEEEALGWVRRM